MPMQLVAVVPGLRTDVAVPSAQIGGSERITTYTGYARFELVKQGFVEASDPWTPVPVAFFVPDSLSYPVDPPQVGLELSWRSWATLGSSSPMPHAIVEDRVDVVADPQGGPGRWLRVAFATTFTAVLRHEVNYRVTTVSPIQR